MCSMPDARLAKIEEAIKELAAVARARAARGGDVSDMAERVAGIWAMIADLDPALASRLSGYCPDTQ